MPDKKNDDEIIFICKEDKTPSGKGKDDFTFYLKDNNDEIVKELFKKLSGENPEDATERLANAVEILAKAQPMLVRAQSDNERLDVVSKGTKRKEYAYPCKIKIQNSNNGIIKTGRALACFCYENELWSVTFRTQEQREGYEPRERDLEKTDLENLNSVKEICDIIYEQVFTLPKEEASASDIHGLLVITGSTNSAKSLITRGLIYQQLYNQKEDYKTGKRKRKPHLVTYEDPIERYYQTGYDNDIEPQTALKMKGEIDYTPRQKGKDASCLRDVLQDALRQTPSVLFVGETRDENEWKELIRFAGTGHLVVTTAHAGSLVEGMHNIFKALNVKTPAQRNEIASHLVGLVHLRKEEIAGISILVPALWRGTARGLNALTSDGLASVLPHRPSDRDKSNDKDKDTVPLASCLGRRWFIEKLLNEPVEEKVKKVLTKEIFCQEDFKYLNKIKESLFDEKNGLSKYLKDKHLKGIDTLFTEIEKNSLSDDGKKSKQIEIKNLLTDGFNKTLDDPKLYTQFDKNKFSSEIKAIIECIEKDKPQGDELHRLNRRLLNFAYSEVLTQWKGIKQLATEWDLRGA